MHIYQTDMPIDHWEGAMAVSNTMEMEIMQRMPELPRNQRVYKTYFPYQDRLEPIYFCKAENNGTTYMFTEHDLTDRLMDIIPI